MTAKEMAQIMVGDGQSPNKYFVTIGPWYLPQGEEQMQIIPGFDADSSETIAFDNKEEALACYNGVNLNLNYGYGQVMLEDRMVGVLCEKILREKIVYIEEEFFEMPA